jgi:hypothetical protein
MPTITEALVRLSMISARSDAQLVDGNATGAKRFELGKIPGSLSRDPLQKRSGAAPYLCQQTS